MKSTIIKGCLLACFIALTSCAESDSTTSSEGGAGQSGSLASMVVADGQLHILNNERVRSFDLSGEMLLQEASESDSRFWRAETLMNYQDKYLLIGSDSGVIVYDFKNQQELSRVNHIQARDPVIAIGATGYFTTRDEDVNFQSIQDTVNIIDLTDIENATLVFTSELLKEPLGLALYGDELLVCDKASGLSRFDIIQEEGEVASELVYISSNANLPCNDVIVKDDLIILVHSDGATQFTMENDEMIILSQIY